MSQTGDYQIDNASGSTVREDINDTLTNILTANSEGTAPSYKQAGTLWLDTSENPDVFKYYTGNDSDGWRSFLDMDGNGRFSTGNHNVTVGAGGFIEITQTGGVPYIDFKRRDVDVDCRIIQSNDTNYDLKISTGGDVNNFGNTTTQFKGNGGVVLPKATQGHGGAGVICTRGFNCRTGYETDSGNGNAASANTVNNFNFWWDASGSDAYFYIDNTRLGHIDASTTSDYRIKREVTTLDVNGIDRVKQLRPVSYKYTDYEIFKSSEVVHEGFIAHEVGEVIPDACKGEKDKNLQNIGLAPLVATLTKALQEAVAKIETLETKVAALEAK